MVRTRLKTIAARVLVGVLLAGAGLLAHQALADKPQALADPKTPTVAAPEEKGARPARLELTPETFAQFRQLIRPNDNEETWRQVRWYTDLWMARQRAAAEDKPILVFNPADGAGVFDPLGRC